MHSAISDNELVAERLQGRVESETLLESVPDIGLGLARIIREMMNRETLEALEVAANEGRLESVTDVRTRRAQMIRAALAAMLGRRPPAPRRRAAPAQEASIVTNQAGALCCCARDGAGVRVFQLCPLARSR